MNKKNKPLIIGVSLIVLVIALLVIIMFMMGIIVNIMKNGEKDLDFEYKNEKNWKRLNYLF